MSYEVLTLVTNRAKQRFQEGIRLGYALKVTHFVVGNQGHDPSSPITALTPDPGYDPTPNSAGHRIPEDATLEQTLVTSAEDDPNFVTIWTCDMSKGVGTGVVSSFYLLAKTVYPVTHPEYDKLFVYAFAYLPMSVKTDNEAWVFRAGVQY